MKRFTSDLLRILKAQASKQMNVSLFSAVYEKTLGRPFDPRDYGLCQLSDLLAQVAEASVVVMATADGEEIIALPKREQTLEEMERTKQFAVEVSITNIQCQDAQKLSILFTNSGGRTT